MNKCHNSYHCLKVVWENFSQCHKNKLDQLELIETLYGVIRLQNEVPPMQCFNSSKLASKKILLSITRISNRRVFKLTKHKTSNF